MRSEKPLLHGDITASIIESFFEVHRELGFGFREYLYARALQRLLIAKGHNVAREVPVMVHFRGEPLAYERMDMSSMAKSSLRARRGNLSIRMHRPSCLLGSRQPISRSASSFILARQRASTVCSSRIGSNRETGSHAVAVAMPFLLLRPVPLPE